MEEPECPYCNKRQTQKPVKSWAYGKMIEKRTDKGTSWGSSVNCARYKCKCSKYFNFYSSKNKNWTIPKPQK